MIIRVNGRDVDVLRKDCASRPCFGVGVDRDFREVCSTRHHRGCPTNSVCQRCRLASVLDPGGTCEADWRRCDGLRVSPTAPSKPFVFSIHRNYLQLFRAGLKRFEFRTRRPAVSTGEYHLIYETAPRSMVVADVKIGAIIEGKPATVWDTRHGVSNIGGLGGISREEFDEYFAGRDRAVAIEMTMSWLSSPVALPDGMAAPQAWARWKGPWPLR